MSGEKHELQGDNNKIRQSQVVVVTVPFPAYGHINQLLHLSNRITSFQIQVHCAGFTTQNCEAKVRVSDTAKIHFLDIPAPPFEPVHRNPNTSIHFPSHFHQISEYISHLRQPVFQLLQQLSRKFKRIIVIHDSLMASVVQDVKLVSNAESYTFLSMSAFTIFFSKWESLPEKPFLLDVPTCIIPSREGCFTREFEEFMINQHKLLPEFESGRLFNTSRLIEGKYMELLEKLQPKTNANNKRLFAIGPFNPVVQMKDSNGSRHECLEWLDKQEKDSVIYISFGTVTPMDDDQIKQLSLALQTSRQKFILSLRNSSFSSENAVNSNLLPNGGIVLTDWAPQLEILAHPATGGFIIHCGWSSCMESITMGVPIVAWPMHSDQPMNSILMTQVLRIGILVRNWDDRSDIGTADVVEDAIMRLMASEDGDEMRKRAGDLGRAVRGSVLTGGCLRLELESFIAHIIR